MSRCRDRQDEGEERRGKSKQKGWKGESYAEEERQQVEFWEVVGRGAVKGEAGKTSE